MDKFIELTDTEINTVSGGTYYGNGVSCDSKNCYVDWGKAWECGVNRWAGSVGSLGRTTIGNC